MMPLDQNSGGSEIALHTYRPDPFPHTLDLPRDTSARDMLVKLSAQELRRQARQRLTDRRFGSRFDDMWAIYHAPSAPLLIPIILIAALFVFALLGVSS